MWQIIEEGIHGGSRGESLSLYVRDPSGNVIELKGRRQLRSLPAPRGRPA
jgi:extradiol dioxygenase family protein